MEPRRTHDFTGVPRELAPTVDQALELIDRIDEDFETQRMRLLEVFDWLETAVTAQVDAERAADVLRAELAERDGRIAASATELAEAAARSDTRERELLDQIERQHAEIVAIEQTKLFRIARPLRTVYAALRRRRG
jgi:molybdopterin-biosynthesis enzyme MoeA-like protein